VKILFLDTSSFFINIAIANGSVITHHQEKNDNKLSERIFLILKQVFQNADITPQMLDKIYVANGPGSFTGIRVGLSIAKTLAWDLKIPIQPLSTFVFYASSYSEDIIISLYDRDEKGYIGFYNKNLTKKEEEYTNIGDFLSKYQDVKHFDIEKAGEVEIDFFRLIKKFAKKEEAVHGIKANYLKPLSFKKIVGDNNE